MTIQFWNGKPQRIYNIDQTKKQYVRFEDIENVAWTDRNNYFYYFNFFNNIRVKTINDISGTIFVYFTGLSENIQDFINLIKLKLTNYNYSNGKTTISNNFQTLDIECGSIQSSNIASNNINIKKLNVDKISSISLKSNIINCNSLLCNNLEYKNNIGIYLYLNNICIPLNKSINKTDLNFNNIITNIKLTIQPNYLIEFYNNGLITFTNENISNNINYFIDVDNLEFTNIKIYFKNIILI